MTTHDLKIWPEFFRAVEAGTKRHEIRLDDRGFQTGDFVVLREWDPNAPEAARRTGREARYRVGHISKGHPLMEGWVVFSLLPLLDDEGSK